MKILIIRFSSIGDIVLTTPVMRCIKQQRPDVEIHYLSKPQFKSILESNPYIDKLHLLDERIEKTLDQLKAEAFDHVIDLHHNLRTRRIKAGLLGELHSFNKLNIRKWIRVALRIDILPEKHIVDRYLDTVKFLNIKNDGKGLDYFIPEADRMDSFRGHELLKPYIAFVIGATHFTKRLPLQKIIDICKRIKQPIYLIGGKDERETAVEIVRLAGSQVINTCGELNLNQSASLVQQADKVISHDTGMMHIAAAFKRPVVSVWGNTIPEFGMYPYYGDTEVPNLISEVNVWCRPCSKIGYSKCPLGHFKCMKRQDEDVISEFVS